MTTSLAFSGKIGAGKTEISKILAARIGAQWCSFGTVIKRVADERKIELSRVALQTLGEQLACERPHELCRMLMEQVHGKDCSNGLMIDGLRHKHILDLLRTMLSPGKVLSVYITVPESLRIERLRLRRDSAADQLDLLDEHPMERISVQKLASEADYLLENDNDLESSIRALAKWLQSEGGSSRTSLKDS